MIKYELINPSDKIFFEADSFKVAAIATLVIGNGSYGARPEGDSEKEVPIFILGGAIEWYAETFHCEFERELDDKDVMLSVAECFNTFSYNSEESTSLNPIVGRAKGFSAHIQRRFKNEAM